MVRGKTVHVVQGMRRPFSLPRNQPSFPPSSRPAKRPPKQLKGCRQIPSGSGLPYPPPPARQTAGPKGKTAGDGSPPRRPCPTELQETKVFCPGDLGLLKLARTNDAFVPLQRAPTVRRRTSSGQGQYVPRLRRERTDRRVHRTIPPRSSKSTPAIVRVFIPLKRIQTRSRRCLKTWDFCRESDEIRIKSRKQGGRGHRQRLVTALLLLSRLKQAAAFGSIHSIKNASGPNRVPFNLEIPVERLESGMRPLFSRGKWICRFHQVGEKRSRSSTARPVPSARYGGFSRPVSAVRRLLRAPEAEIQRHQTLSVHS